MDKIIFGPTIYTMDEDKGSVEAVGLKDGKVEVLGTKEKVTENCGTGVERLEPSAESMFPGFLDSHVHFLDLGLNELFYLDLGDVSSKKELLEKIEEGADKNGDEEWLLGNGWDESKWEDEGEFPTKEELDRVVPDRPVAIQRVDMHTFAVNSKGIEKLDISPSLEGARRKGGEFTGIFSEEASLRVKETIAFDREDSARALRESINEAHRRGVTSINQMVVDPGEFKRYLGAYGKLNKESNLGVRSRIYFTKNYLDSFSNLGLEAGFGDDKLRIGGLKLFTDGAIGSKTAWTTRSYKGEPENHGISMLGDKELNDLVKRAHENGIQVAIHAIGDRALDQAIGSLGEVIENGRNRLRHRIEHCEMATDEQIEKMAELNIIACMQPNFVGEWGLPGSMYEERFDGESLSDLDRFKVFEEEGVPLAFGSDGMPFGPLYGIHWAVNSPFDSQRLSPESAFRAYTKGAAYVEGMEKKVGSIEQGKYADFVLLDGDPLKNPGEIKEMEIEKTFLEGGVVYD